MNRLRVGSLQYFIRLVQSIEQFRDEVVALIETPADYNCRLHVLGVARNYLPHDPESGGHRVDQCACRQPGRLCRV